MAGFIGNCDNTAISLVHNILKLIYEYTRNSKNRSKRYFKLLGILLAVLGRRESVNAVTMRNRAIITVQKCPQDNARAITSAKMPAR